MPTACPGVPPELLDSRRTWADPAAYDAQAHQLARLFRKNFEQFGDVASDIREGGPAVNLAKAEAGVADADRARRRERLILKHLSAD